MQFLVVIVLVSLFTKIVTSMILRGTIAAVATVVAVAVLFEVRLAAAEIVISEISS